MKTLSIAMLALFATLTMNAQDLKKNDVPSNLQTSFDKTYPNAQDVEWNKDGQNYKVEFDLNKMEHEVWYSEDGTTIKTETEIDVNTLPSSVSNTIKSKYADYKIDSAEIREEAGKSSYEVEIEKAMATDRTLVLDANGTILSDVED